MTTATASAQASALRAAAALIALRADYWLALGLPRHLVHIGPPALLSTIEEPGFGVA